MQPDLRKIRRDFHRFPETGWMEMRTASLIARRLQDLGYEVLTGRQVCLADARMGVPEATALHEHCRWAEKNGADGVFLEKMRDGFTGVIGILRCGDGPSVALRFDMDALAVEEADCTTHVPAGEGFRSEVPGKMHACGHDGHMAIGLGTAGMLAGMRENLHGTVKIIFQPAEEGVRGARSIVAKGHLDDVDFVLGSHITASPDEECYICPGMAGTYATTKLDAVFHGSAAHASAAPQEGRNALLAAASAALNIHAVPRHGDGISRVNVGTLQAGTSRNVICDYAKMEIEVRGETEAINAYMEEAVMRILNGAAGMQGCDVDIRTVGTAGVVESVPAFAERIEKICREKLGLRTRRPDGLGASEDFSLMTKRVIERGGQACFTGICVPCAGVLHSADFDFDERALELGVKYYSGVVAELLQ